MGLHAKAFGQDVYTVKFSIDDDRRLTTSGTGHIRFWKMAATFTGLKLQGSIGKFGKVELSDISAFVELPDGKVISGTESGALLLWEGNFIKCRFVLPGGSLCHHGEVTYLQYDRDDHCIISASLDGIIKWWDVSVMDTAEVDSDNTIDFEISPVAEYVVGHDRGIKDLVDSGKEREQRFFIVLDVTGCLSIMRFPVLDVVGVQAQIELTSLKESHAGRISGMDTSPMTHIAITCGEDGTVRAWNYLERRFLGLSRFPVGATALKWVPTCLEKSGLTVAVGFADGCVRLLQYRGMNNGEWDDVFTLVMVFKPHSCPVTALSFSNDGYLLATSGKDGTLFFHHCEPLSETDDWTPIRFATLKSSDPAVKSVYVSAVSWDEKDGAVLCTCSDGCLREVDVGYLRSIYGDDDPTKRDVGSYAHDFPVKELVIRTTAVGLPQPKSATELYANIEEEMEAIAAIEAGASGNLTPGEQPEFLKAPVQSALYARGELRESWDVLVGATGGPTSQLLAITNGEEIPKKELLLGLYSVDGKEQLRAPTVTYMGYGWTKQFVVLGTALGTCVVRPVHAIETLVTAVSSSVTCGGVSVACMSFDDNFLLSAGREGVLSVFRVNTPRLIQSSSAVAENIEKSTLVRTAIKPKSLLEPSFASFISPDTVLDVTFPVLEMKDALPVSAMWNNLAEVDDLPEDAYSIEEDKLRTEEDGKRNHAEHKKDKVRAIVKALQREYEHLVTMNSRLPKQVQLSAEAMTVDGDYVLELMRRGEERIVEVHKECAYEAEKAQRLKEKLIERLMDSVLVEEIPLRGFRAKRPIVVHSLRTRGLDAALKEVVDFVHASVRSDMMAEARSKTNVTKAISRSLTKGEDGAGSYEGGSGGEDGRSGERRGGSAAARRELRKRRKANIEAHLLMKPSEDEDDARDIRAIHMAEQTLGSYKLKCAEDYEVPEEQRVNAEKKRRQMVLLEESIITMKLRFNERFLALRQLKKQMIETCRKDNQRVQEIDFELQIVAADESYGRKEQQLDPEEFPDDRDEITERELSAFRETRKTTPWHAAEAPRNSVVTGNRHTPPLSGVLIFPLTLDFRYKDGREGGPGYWVFPLDSARACHSGQCAN